MRLLIKIAGALLKQEDNVQRIARQIAELARAGHEMLIVHGGERFLPRPWRAWELRAAL